MYEPTGIYRIDKECDDEIRRVILEVYAALKERGYNPFAQVTGYILSEDPTYITIHNNARTKMSKLDRDEILEAMVKWYLSETTLR